MKNRKDDQKTERTAELEAELKELEQVLAEKQIEKQQAEQRLQKLKREFQAVTDSQTWKLVQSPKKVKKFLRSTAAYALGRRNRKQLYSEEYKRKSAANQLKKYKYHLYNLGFEEKALDDLENLYKGTDSKYIKQAIAWELTLLYASKYTKPGAARALNYISEAMKDEDDPVRLRRGAIMKAECLAILQRNVEGQAFMQQVLTFQDHPDLYLAAAGVEETLEKRLAWINKALDVYGVTPLTMSQKDTETVYDRLTSIPNYKIENGPKVTVIIPAYNAENGIKTAMDSILMQTWQNIELIIVDDCSPDETREVIEAYAEKDERIKLLSTPKNSGPYVARNIALKEATGDFVTINDSDDWSHPVKIETQAKHLIDNPNLIANTSEQARMTEDLTLYRRGTPGHYIFTNMSSLMFRRVPVIEEIGFWDEVRFAADSEFIKRIGITFGKERIVDLKTGPLSFPRQSPSSLTGSSAFGYNGFLMGARKEYAEVHRHHHKNTNTLIYPHPQKERAYPVPEPMWPEREKKQAGFRQFDIVIAGDFRLPEHKLQSTIEEIKMHKQLGLRTGLIQMAYYDLKMPKEINELIRNQVNGDAVQMLVYGEKIVCENLMIKNAGVLQEKQKYIPEVEAANVRVVIDELPDPIYFMRVFSTHVAHYFDRKGTWYPADEKIREKLSRNKLYNVKYINLSTIPWDEINKNMENYSSYLERWTMDKNPYLYDDKGEDLY
ncbi:glycosyltransferase family 2 protein [Virgibacillus oceani]